MSVKKFLMVKRSLWIADCPNCEYRTESASDKRPAKELQCPECKTWIKYKEEEFTSEEYSSKTPLGYSNNMKSIPDRRQ